MAACCTGLDLIEISDLWSKVKVTMALYPFFLHNSLLTSILSALSCPISRLKWNVVRCLDRPFGRFVFEFNKIRIGDDVIVTSIKFLQTIVHISNSLNIQTPYLVPMHNIHLMVKVTMTGDEGHTRRSKVTKDELMVNILQIITLTYIITRTKIQYHKQYLMT